MAKLSGVTASTARSSGAGTTSGIARTAEPKLREWERRYNHELFSLALAGKTPAEKQAAKIFASPAPGTVPVGAILPS